MKRLPDGTLTELPIIRPLSASPSDFKDGLLKATSLSRDEQDQLIHALGNYIQE
jgi:hypothetical protein